MANNMAGEILVVPFHSLGHTFPSSELCRRLASLGHRVTIFLPPSSSTSLQLHNPLITIVESTAPPPPPPPHPQHQASTSDLENYLTKMEESSLSSRSSLPVLFAVVDAMMSHLVETCRKHGVPVVSFFTSSACSAAIEHGATKLSLGDMDLDDAVVIPGFPDGLGLKVVDLIRGNRPPPISPPPPFDAATATPIHAHGFHGPDGRPPPPGPPPSFDSAHGSHSHPPPPPPFDAATATPIHGRGFHGPEGRPPPPGPPPPFDSAHGSHSHPPPPPFDAATATPIHGHGFHGPDGRPPPPGTPPSFNSAHGSHSHPPPPSPPFDTATATAIHGHGFHGLDGRPPPPGPPPSFDSAHGPHSHPPPPPPPFDAATATAIHGHGFHGPDGRPPPPGPPPSVDSVHGPHSHPPPLPPPFDAATATAIHSHSFHGPDGRPPPPGLPPSFASVHGSHSHPPPGPPPPKTSDGQPGTNAGPSSNAPLGPAGDKPEKGGRPPRGIGETDGAIALIFNTCDDLERPFLEYISKETGKPAWGVGPLLPAGFWDSNGGPVHDQAVRSKHESNVTEREALKWFDSKPPGSVLYISFGTLEGPSHDELLEIALALEDFDAPFIWVLQTGPGPRATTEDPFGSSSRARERGLVIRGWAPQLLILSHPSTGGFLSHCGWNSTTEAMACGVRMLTWPLKGDQFHNEKLVVEGLKMGQSVFRGGGGPDKKVGREDVRAGMEEMMRDKEMEARAVRVRSFFTSGFPESSSRSLQSLVDFCHHAN